MPIAHGSGSKTVSPKTAKERAAQLSALRSPDLRARAKEVGVEDDALASLKDTEFDVNSAMISLILRRLEDPNKPLPFTGQRVLARDSSSRTAVCTKWSEAVKAGGLSTWEVMFWVIIRLAWHLGPPIVFLYALVAVLQCEEDDTGLSSGSAGRRSPDVSMIDTPFVFIVCAWWIICIALVLVCVCVNPSFLLVDLRASFRDGYFT